MAEKKNDSGFTVTDRRLFTAEGELRPDVAEAESEPPAKTAPKEAAPEPAQAATPEAPATDREMPPAPSTAEQEAQAAAYRNSSKELDTEVEKSGHSARDFEITFEKFLASLYMTAMLQLGLMRRQGEQPQVDIIGARQTIDTLSLLAEKTKGNLTPAEENFLQNSLYELRMAYVEVTNAIARPPQPGPATGTTGR
jgi:pyruvate/2-oxoglutarate dehydrogenase complex dihydrolipoamide acyltransferase (E2) component